MSTAALAVGGLLVAVGAVIALGDIDGLATRMPTQVPPRSFARVPLLAGCALIVVGVVGRAMP